MSSSLRKEKNEIGEVSELFCPTLDQDKTARFNNLINRIGQAYPNYREQIVQQELNTFAANADNIEDMKYKAALSALAAETQKGNHSLISSRKRYEWKNCFCKDRKICRDRGRI